MGMMTIVYKLNNFSATDNVLVYRARRFFRMCVCGEDVDSRRVCYYYYSIMYVIILNFVFNIYITYFKYYEYLYNMMMNI